MRVIETDRFLRERRYDLRSPFAMNGRTMSGRWSSVSKHTPNNLRTLGWSNPSMRIDSLTKSSMFSGVEMSVGGPGGTTHTSIYQLQWWKYFVEIMGATCVSEELGRLKKKKKKKNQSVCGTVGLLQANS